MAISDNIMGWYREEDWQVGHVPQNGLTWDRDGYERNPYHAACSKCGAEAGNYCARYIDGVGYVPHRERVEAARREADCATCLETYGPTRSKVQVNA